MNNVDEKINKVVAYLENEKTKLVELLPEYLRKEFTEESYIAGGCIRSVYRDLPISDIDIFVETLGMKIALESYFKRLDGLSTLKRGSQTIKIGSYKGNKLVVTDNAITIGKFQIVLRDVGQASEVLQRFDFRHNMYYIKNNKFYNEVELYYLELDQLRYNDNRARDIVGTIMRIPKFIKKGFSINHKELAKILLKLHNVGFNEHEIEVLQGKIGNMKFESGD